MEDKRVTQAGFFNALFAEHQRVLFAFLYGQTGLREHAEDLLQQVFVRVWTHIEEARTKPQDALLPWLFSIASNVAIDFHRRQSSRPKVIDGVLDCAVSKDNPAQTAEQRQLMQELNQAIRNLPNDERIAFTMTVLGEMSSEEVGIVLGKPPGTIRYLVSQARKRLSQKVNV